MHKEKHRLASLRASIGLTQSEMAELIGCSVDTVKSVELGRLKLSESLAQKITVETGVSLDWLFQSGTSDTPVTRGGEVIDKAYFERMQAGKKDAALQGIANIYEMRIAREWIDVTVIGVLLAASQSGKLDLAHYKLKQVIKELGKEFGISAAISPLLKLMQETGVDLAKYQNVVKLAQMKEQLFQDEVQHVKKLTQSSPDGKPQRSQKQKD